MKDFPNSIAVLSAPLKRLFIKWSVEVHKMFGNPIEVCWLSVYFDSLDIIILLSHCHLLKWKGAINLPHQGSLGQMGEPHSCNYWWLLPGGVVMHALVNWIIATYFTSATQTNSYGSCKTVPPCVQIGTAVSSEAWATLREWAILASKGRLLLSGRVVLASLKAAE